MHRGNTGREGRHWRTRLRRSFRAARSRSQCGDRCTEDGRGWKSRGAKRERASLLRSGFTRRILWRIFEKIGYWRGEFVAFALSEASRRSSAQEAAGKLRQLCHSLPLPAEHILPPSVARAGVWSHRMSLRGHTHEVRRHRIVRLGLAIVAAAGVAFFATGRVFGAPPKAL